MSPEPVVAAAIIFCCMAAHAAFIAGGFLANYVDAENRGRAPPPLRYARAFVMEWWFTFGMLLLYPLGWLPRLERKFDPAGGPPILLVHGYAMNRSSMFVLCWRLQRAGYRNLYTVNLPTTRGLEAVGHKLAAEIDALKRLTGRRVICVCHSMGGVAARWVLAQHDDAPVDRLITYCSPHQGTRLAVLGLDDGMRDLRLGSEALARLPGRVKVPMLAVVAGIDNVVVPPQSAAFGPRVIELPDAGHMTPLYESRGFRALLDVLPEPTPVGAHIATS